MIKIIMFIMVIKIIMIMGGWVGVSLRTDYHLCLRFALKVTCFTTIY